MSLRRRLIAYLLIGLLPIVLVSIFFFWESYRARVNQVLQGHMATAQALAGTVREFVDGIVRTQDIIGWIIESGRMSPTRMTAYFRQVEFHTGPILETIGFADVNGVIVAGRPDDLIGLNVSRRSYFRRVAAGSHFAVSDVLESLPTGAAAFIIAHRIERDDRFAGCLLSAISPASIEGFVSARESPDIGYGILDSRGRIIVSTVLADDLIPHNKDRSWIPSVRRALRGRPAFATPFRDRADGVVRMGASVPVPQVGWVVDVFEPVSVAMAPVRRAATIELAVLSVITLALAGTAWFVGTGLSRPIRLLARRAQAVGQGDFSQRVPVPDRAELGTLAQAFNSMTAELERFRQEQELARRQAMFFSDIGELLSSSLDPNVIVQTVTERTATFLGVLVLIFELRSDGGLAKIAGHSQDADLLRKVDEIVAEHPPTLDIGLAGMAVRLDQTQFVPDRSDIEDPDVRFYMERLDIQSEIAVPMRVHGQAIGALLLASADHRLTEIEVPVAEDLARRLGIALENIHLYESALERERFQRRLIQLASAVSSTLDSNEVLGSICRESREILGADGAYIWVLRDDERALYGSSACGWKAEEFIGMVLPLSETGAAAVQALSRREGFYINNMQESEDGGRALTEKFDTRSALFQPLLSGGMPLGVMVIADSHDPNKFDDTALEQTRILAGYAATSLANANAYERERRIAETLQRGLLPEMPEAADSFELAHFYTPARQEAAIGGDFYDFIDLSDGRYALVVGDVSGKGLSAAVVTAMAKYAIRAYAAEDPSPDRVVSRANDAIVKYTPSDLFITLVYGLLDAEERKVTYASAGHEPVLIYRRETHVVETAGTTGMAAGIVHGASYTNGEFVLGQGDVAVMYTDGLTEARSPDGGLLGLERLSRSILELADLPAPQFLTALIDRIKGFTEGEFADDVAVLVIRAVPS